MFVEEMNGKVADSLSQRIKIGGRLIVTEIYIQNLAAKRWVLTLQRYY